MKELQSVTFSKKCACSKMTKELQSVKRNDYLQYITIYCHQFWKVLFLYRSHCQYSFVDTWFCVFIFSIFYIEPKGKIVQAKTNLFKKLVAVTLWRFINQKICYILTSYLVAMFAVLVGSLYCSSELKANQLLLGVNSFTPNGWRKLEFYTVVKQNHFVCCLSLYSSIRQRRLFLTNCL